MFAIFVGNMDPQKVFDVVSCNKEGEMIGLEGDVLTRYIIQSIEHHDRHVERLAK